MVQRVDQRECSHRRHTSPFSWDHIPSQDFDQVRYIIPTDQIPSMDFHHALHTAIFTILQQIFLHRTRYIFHQDSGRLPRLFDFGVAAPRYLDFKVFCISISSTCFEVFHFVTLIVMCNMILQIFGDCQRAVSIKLDSADMHFAYLCCQ